MTRLLKTTCLQEGLEAEHSVQQQLRLQLVDGRTRGSGQGDTDRKPPWLLAADVGVAPSAWALRRLAW